MKEIFKDVGDTGFKISNLGRIKSKYGRVLKMRDTGTGYLGVRVLVNGEKNKFKAHREVAKAFIPNPSNKPQVNHIDGNKQNNCVDNLEWTTVSENARHSYNKGFVERKLNRHLVECIRHIGVKERGDQKYLASIFDVDKSIIKEIINFTIWK